MTKRDFAAIVLKLTGVYILVRYLGYLPIVFGPIVMMWGDPTLMPEWQLWLAMLPPWVYLAFCVLIVVKSEAIAAKLIKQDGEFHVGFRLSKEDVLTLAFCCIGLVILVGSLPVFVEAIARFAVTQNAALYASSSQHWIGSSARLAAAVVQVLIGLGLFLQARGLAALWFRLRNGLTTEDHANNMPTDADRPNRDTPGDFQDVN